MHLARGEVGATKNHHRGAGERRVRGRGGGEVGTRTAVVLGEAVRARIRRVPSRVRVRIRVRVRVRVRVRARVRARVRVRVTACSRAPPRSRAVPRAYAPPPPRARCSAPPRYRRDVGEMWVRSRGDLGEI